MNRDDLPLHDLIDRYLRGEMDAQAVAEFERILREDDGAREVFRRTMRLDANLRATACERNETLRAWAVTAPAPAPPPPQSWFRRGPWLMVATAALLMIGVFAWNRSLTTSDDTAIAEHEPSATGFAVVTGQVDARWGGGRTITSGDLLGHESLRLDSGVVQIDLFSGVSMVIEGAAEFDIVSPMEMNLIRGKARVRVPEPAHGFRIRTAQGEVVDLGTEFALDATPEQSEVHVLDGQVEWHPRTTAMVSMDKGQAMRWNSDGRLAAMAADATAFLGADDLADKLSTLRASRHQSWKESAKTLANDPRLVVFFQMEAHDLREQRLPNQALAGIATVAEGAVVAPNWVADRWGMPGTALDFSRTGSGVRMDVPGKFSSLTLLTWVKIYSLDRWYNSLFLTDGHDPHEPHWQIMDDGRLFFAIKKYGPKETTDWRKSQHVFYSPVFWNPTLSGKWLMLATVYDADAKIVTHYLNGKQLSRENIPEEYLDRAVTIRGASLGNWSDPMNRTDPKFVIRNLNGVMDEFAFFSAALTEAEIEAHYRNSTPQ